MGINKEDLIKKGFSNEEINLAYLLECLAKELTNKNMILGGGTALLLKHGLTRPSTDLDLYTDLSINSLDLKNKVSKCFKELNVNLLEFNKDEKKNHFHIYYKCKYNNVQYNFTISCFNNKEKLKYKSNFSNDGNIYTFNIKNICTYKTEAFVTRDKIRDIFDINFLINKYPKYFNDNRLKEIKDKLDKFNKEHIKELFLKDNVLKRYNSDDIINTIYKNINNIISYYNNIKHINNIIFNEKNEPFLNNEKLEFIKDYTIGNSNVNYRKEYKNKNGDLYTVLDVYDNTSKISPDHLVFKCKITNEFAIKYTEKYLKNRLEEYKKNKNSIKNENNIIINKKSSGKNRKLHL